MKIIMLICSKKHYFLIFLILVFIIDVTVSSSHTHFYFLSVCCTYLTVWHLKEIWYYVYKNLITHLFGFSYLIQNLVRGWIKKLPIVFLHPKFCLLPGLKYLTWYHIFSYPQLIFPLNMGIFKFLTSTNQVAKS